MSQGWKPHTLFSACLSTLGTLCEPWATSVPRDTRCSHVCDSCPALCSGKWSLCTRLCPPHPPPPPSVSYVQKVVIGKARAEPVAGSQILLELSAPVLTAFLVIKISRFPGPWLCKHQGCFEQLPSGSRLASFSQQRQFCVFVFNASLPFHTFYFLVPAFQ